jgi:salicylate hydroxylase
MRGMRQLNIALIGAGIAGLTAARALQTHGCRVRVYEQADELGEVGAGLTISPNATHVLNALGLRQTLETIGMRPSRGGVKHWRSGETIVEILRGQEMLDRYGAAYYQVHRADLHAALAALVLAADPEALLLGHKFVEVRECTDGIEARFANGATVTADVLIGADGARSPVRTQVFGASQPRFTGYIAYRGLVATADLPAGLLEPSSCISIGPGHTFTRYLIRGGQTVNYVGLAERDDWREEGWSIRSSVEELLAEFAGWHEGVRAIIRATPPQSIFKWALFDRDPLPAWTRGHVTLIGDAAHPMLPFLGQGAAMGIEDALVLARAFAESDSVDEALQRYEAARRARTTYVMLKSRETARSYHGADPDNYTAARHISAESLGLMSYNPAAVPV